MKKKEYIQPKIKLHIRVLESLMYDGPTFGSGEQGNNPADSEARGASFMDNESGSAWGNVWK